MALRTRPIPLTLAALLTTLPAVAQQQPAAPPAQPPVAAVRPTQLEKHGHVRVDDYYWLRERADSEVIRYLEAENAYTQAVMAHTEALQERLFEEIQGRIKQTDASVPYRQGRYYYYTRFEEGKSYPIYARKRVSLD
ncbi:MAG: oligopeptidase B, partial [Dehalococcoidia bacterium]